MEFGIAIPSAGESWKIARRAEQLGFGHAWFYDTQLLCGDPFVAMAAAAMQTEKIRLGTGVLIPSNRISPVTANALATLNQIAPGRIDLGVGTGFTGRRTMGLRAIKLADFREYLQQVYGLLAGDTVEAVMEGATRKIRFLNPQLGLINTEDQIRLHISAFGPKSRALVAEFGAGWLNFVFDGRAAAKAVGAMRTTWTDAGHAPDTFYGTGMTMGCVLKDGEAADGARAMAQAAPQAAVYLHSLTEDRPDGPDPSAGPSDRTRILKAYAERYARYQPADARYLHLHTGHMLFVRDDERDLMSEDLIRDKTLTGTAPEIRDRIQALAEAGYTQLAFQITPGQEDAIDDWAAVVAGL